VLQRLREFGLNWNAEKCHFSVSEVDFLGFVMTPDGVGMDSDRISTIDDWPTQKAVRDVQVLLGITNFYRRFIRKYAKVTLPPTALLKKSETSRGKTLVSSAKWEWTRESELGFRKLKRTFTEALIVQHFDTAKAIILQSDASGFAIAGILNQYNVFGVLSRVNFYSRKCSPPEQNYGTYERELLAIVATLKQWRHYLEGANYKVLIRCDHKNLEYFQLSIVLSRRQARLSEILSAYDFVIEHLEANKNPAHGPSRRPDYEIGYKRPVARLLATAPVEPYDDLMPAIIAAQASDSLAANVSAKLVDRPAAVSTESAQKETQWEVVAGALTYARRIYVPAVDSLRGKVISRFDGNSEGDHFGSLNTTKLVSRDIYWPAMDSHVCRYVSGWEVCHRITAPRHARHGIIMPLEAPSQPWEDVTMHFVPDLPESTASGYTGILVMMDRLTKIAIYLPCRKDIDLPELARLLFEHVI